MKHFKKIFIPVALAATLSLSAFLAACGKDDPPIGGQTDAWRDQSIWMTKEALVPEEEAVFPEDVAYNRVNSGSVHDPSIFHDPESGAYYAYGTHYAVAKTYEFDTAYASSDDGGWEQLAGDNGFQFLFGNEEATYGGKKYPAAIRETVERVKPTSSDSSATTWSIWAPDVEYINGKYYLYYSFTKAFGSNESAIGRVESDSPEGPFENNRIVIDSVGANRQQDPNCIDPELFYDKDGKLWMVYGSDMGGIFIKELYTDGENAGLPKEDGFGKKLWRGGQNQEGPFIYYNVSTDYYYLMCSYNSLTTNYNMHVARSKTPDGPYVGIDGKDVAVDGDGNQVAGNFKFDRSGNGVSPFAAMGHNSVVKDKSGKYYAVYHVRRYSGVKPGDSKGGVAAPHLVYVSQIYFNEAGWPVMAPTPYVGETRGTMTEERVAKSYDIVIHKAATGTGDNVTFVNSAVYTLTADGKVTGGNATDTRTLKEGYYIELTVKGVTYKGVVAPGWDTYVNSTASQKAVVTISAVSDSGVSLWAVEK